MLNHKQGAYAGSVELVDRECLNLPHSTNSLLQVGPMQFDFFISHPGSETGSEPKRGGNVKEGDRDL